VCCKFKIIAFFFHKPVDYLFDILVGVAVVVVVKASQLQSSNRFDLFLDRPRLFSLLQVYTLREQSTFGDATTGFSPNDA